MELSANVSAPPVFSRVTRLRHHKLNTRTMGADRLSAAMSARLAAICLRVRRLPFHFDCSALRTFLSPSSPSTEISLLNSDASTVGDIMFSKGSTPLDSVLEGTILVLRRHHAVSGNETLLL